MFEVPKDEAQGGRKVFWIVLIVLACVLAAVAGVLLLMSGPGRGQSAATTPTAAPDLANAQPLHDLHLDRASLGKDVTGTGALWSVQIENGSAYTYTNIQYEARYLGPDGRVLAVNQGTLPGEIGPQQTRSYDDVQDILLPSGASTYEFRLLDATPVAP
jgi:hypothetical protein